MAALQGYLLNHKEDPVSAALNAGDWSKEIKARQDEVAAEKARKRAARLEEKEAEKESDLPPTPTSPAISLRIRSVVDIGSTSGSTVWAKAIHEESGYNGALLFIYGSYWTIRII